MKKLILIFILVTLYATGLLQFIVFGDFTPRLGHTFNKDEDDTYFESWFATRWEVIHFIDSL